MGMMASARKSGFDVDERAAFVCLLKATSMKATTLTITRPTILTTMC